MATATPAPLPSALPTAPLPQTAVEMIDRLSAAFAPAVAAQHHIEATVTGIRNGETQVINGIPVTAVSLEVAVAVARYEAASKRTAAISKALNDPEYKRTGLEWDDLAHAREVMTGSHDILAEAGQLDLIGGE